MLVVMAGLPASGKSAVARKLKPLLGATLLDKDLVRANLFAEHVEYSRSQDDLCVDIIYDVACFHLDRRPQVPVILDGRSYSRRYQIEAVKKTAVRAKTALAIIECVCSAQTALVRLEKDKTIHIAKDRDALLYEKSCASAEPIVEPRLTLNTDDNTVEQCVQAARRYLQAQQC